MISRPLIKTITENMPTIRKFHDDFMVITA
jgi:hypothetical protein